jgi:hypothetical protein
MEATFDKTLAFVEHEENPGQGKFRLQPAQEDERYRVITLHSLAKERGWLASTRPDIAILKIDVKGHEHFVNDGAKELMKFQRMRSFLEFMPKVLVGYYKLYKVAGWRGPAEVVDGPKDDDPFMDCVFNATLGKKSKQLDLWWILDERFTSSSSSS